MPPVLFDTSVYILALREEPSAALELIRPLPRGTVWLSAVVLGELYAGAHPEDVRLVERLESRFDGVGRILAPNRKDWTRAGRLLAQLAARYGYEKIGRARLTNDALIVMSAARQGITVITGNKRDFAKLAEFRPFMWQLHTATRITEDL